MSACYNAESAILASVTHSAKSNEGVAAVSSASSSSSSASGSVSASRAGLSSSVTTKSMHPKVHIDHLRRFDDDDTDDLASMTTASSMPEEIKGAPEALIAALSAFRSAQVIACDLCEGAAAAIHCKQCGVHMCGDCNAATHEAARRNTAVMKRHVRLPVISVAAVAAASGRSSESTAWSNVLEKLQDVPFTLIDRAAIVASGNLTPAVTPCKLPEVSVEATESCEVLTRIPWSVEMKAFKSRFTADRKLKTLNAEAQTASQYSYFTKARAQNRQRRRATTARSHSAPTDDDSVPLESLCQSGSAVGMSGSGGGSKRAAFVDDAPRQRSKSVAFLDDAPRQRSKSVAFLDDAPPHRSVVASSAVEVGKLITGVVSSNVITMDLPSNEARKHSTDDWIVTPSLPTLDDWDAFSDSAGSITDRVFGVGEPVSTVSKRMAMRPTRMAMLSMRRHEAQLARQQQRLQRYKSSQHTQGGLMRSVSEGYPLEKRLEVELDAPSKASL
eukprot:gene15308-10769_t